MMTALAQTLDSVTRFLSNSPEGAALVEKARQAEIANAVEDRRSNLRVLTEATAADLQRHASTEKAMAPLLKKLAALQSEIERVNLQIADVRIDDRGRYFTLDQKISRARAALEQNPQPQIAPFLERLHADLATTQAQAHHEVGHTWSGNQAVTWSNMAAVRARTEAISVARHAVRELVLKPIEGRELDDHLEAIWNGLPKVEVRAKD